MPKSEFRKESGSINANSLLDRRDFLKYGSTALALATVAPFGLVAAEAPAKKRNLKKGYMLGTFPGKDLPLIEKFKLLNSVGFDGVERRSHMATGRSANSASTKADCG